MTLTTIEPLPPEPAPDENVPPQDMAAEQSVLGGMLISRAVIDDCMALVRAGDFYRPAHELIFDAIAGLHLAGEPVDAITVTDELAKRGALGRAGGPAYLHDLVARVPVAANAVYYAGIVAGHATRRYLGLAATEIARIAREAAEPDEAVERSRAAVDHVADARRRDNGPTSAAHDVIEALEALEADDPGLATPWADLTEVLGGWRPGALYVVGARPGVGKSLIGIGAALDCARRGRRAHIASLEMSRKEIYHRMLANVGSVDMTRMKNRRLRDDDWKRLAEAGKHIAELPITVSDAATQTVVDIRAQARDLTRHGQIGLIVVDYLQLMQSPGRVESRQTEVASYSRGLKLLAKELEVPVIALSQLNRGSEGRADRRPSMSDLRESGALEQDADAVILLHRDPDEDPGILGVNVEKHRHGPAFQRVELGWQAHYGRLADLNHNTRSAA